MLHTSDMSNYNRIVKVLSRIVAKLQKLEAKCAAEATKRLDLADEHREVAVQLNREATRAANTAKNIAAILG